MSSFSSRLARDSVMPTASPPIRAKPRIIAVAKFKGSVGITTTAVNPAGACILREQQVLLINLDAQWNASTALNSAITADKFGMRYLLHGDDYRVSTCALCHFRYNGLSGLLILLLDLLDPQPQ